MGKTRPMSLASTRFVFFLLIFITGIVLTSNPLLADSIAQMHLANIEKSKIFIRISYWEIPPDGSLKDLQKKLLATAKKFLEKSGISSDNEADVSISIELKIVTDSKRSIIGVTSFLYVLEEVWLQRDPEQSVPGGGALTWWSQAFSPIDSPGLKEALVEIVEAEIENFTEARRAAREIKGLENGKKTEKCKKFLQAQENS